MRISQLNMHFCGVAKPYFDRNNNLITPIAVKPNEDTIEKALKQVTSTNPFAQGLSGQVYHWGEDLVIKKTKPNEQYISKEVEILDKMYDANIHLPGSQTGQFAIQTPNEAYIVSTFVNGDDITPLKNPFTKEKLESIVLSATNMDKGCNFKKTFTQDKNSQYRFMNYDFHLGNIKFDGSQACFLDFENSSFENLDDMIKSRIMGHDGKLDPYRSDTSPLPSNIRAFEFRTLIGYLGQIPNSFEVFNDYLVDKGKYHHEMAKFYQDYSLESSYKDIVLDLSKKESAHSQLLKPDNKGQIPKDILRSEVIKIQMARFVYNTSHYISKGIINQQELQDYTNSAIKFFNSQLESAQKNNDKNRIIYYQEALLLMDDWKNADTKVETYIKNNDKKTIEKLTNNHIKTLEEILDESTMDDKIKMALTQDSLTDIQKRTPLGRGANSVVYEINQDYVLKVLNKDDPNKIDINTFPDEVNLGQPVWISKINPRIMILKRIDGSEHSIPSWSTTIFNPATNMPDKVTPKQAQTFFSKVDKLASMNDEAYLDLAKKVKLIDSKGFKLDSINPNNLIVSDSEINIIDFFKVKDKERHIYQNSSYDILAIMLDFTLFPEYYDKLNEKQKQKLIEDVTAITRKIDEASKKVGLDNNEDKFKTYIRATSRWFTPYSVYENDKSYFRYYDCRLDDFLQMIKDPYLWAKNR